METQEKRRRIARELRRARARGLGAREPIAVIGLAGRLPQSDSVAAFWQALDQDRSLIEEIPKSRFDWERYYDASGQGAGKMRSRWGGFLPDVRGFDARFFNILPSEARGMDPRQRLLLMAVYHALEDGGYAPKSLAGSPTGVFVAAEGNEYLQCLREGGHPIDELGMSTGMLANRISYFFDFRGPSETIDTLCSGGAVALHRAVGSLRSGEVEQAVVGAANLILRPEPLIALTQAGLVSPVPTVQSFGKEARGFLRAEGVVAVLLKPLHAAEACGDPIYGVIRQSAVSYNGQGGLSISATHAASHAELVLRCYRETEVDPRQVSYVEAQGMGNPVADLAEWRAFNGALRRLAQERGVTLPDGGCRVSTLKPLCGHLHSAAALGSLLKILRSFQTDRVHKILDFREVHPDLETDRQPCRLAVATEPWARGAEPRLAGLHSFGSGGSIAHLLVEEYQSPRAPERRRLSGSVFNLTPYWFGEDGGEHRLYYAKRWKTEALPDAPPGDHVVHLVLPAGLGDEAAGCWRHVHLHELGEEGASVAERARKSFTGLVEWLRTWRAAADRALLMVALPAEDFMPYGYLPGLLRTLALDRPELSYRLVVGPGREHRAVWKTILSREAAHPRGALEVRYDAAGARTVAVFEPVPGAAQTARSLLDREGGVYWITGGLGGIGRILAETLSKRPGTRLVLSGRSAPSERARQWLQRIALPSSEVVYHPADVTDRSALAACFATIKQRFGRLDGILHCAGVFHPGSIHDKTPQELEQTLGPKIDGTLLLDEVTREEELSFFVLFSSLASVLGHSGHWDYAAANAFLDEYAAYRNRQVREGSRKGRTIAVNWPSWEQGGMFLDEWTRRKMWHEMGAAQIRGDQGVAVLEEALRMAEEQLVVLTGDRQRLQALFANEPVPSSSSPPPVFDRAERIVRDVLSPFLELSPEALPMDEEFRSLGFDSVLVTRVTAILEEQHAIELDPAVLFECKTPAALLPHVRRGLGGAARPRREAPRRPARPPSRDEIAIIGLAGSYPQAEDLEVFWENLAQGRHCIEEVPADRWPLGPFFEPDRRRAAAEGKSYGKWGGFLEGLYEFDPLFFKISPRDAGWMSPKERLFLQCAWRVLEDAGYRPEDLGNQCVGVFVGVSKVGADLYPDTFSAVANRVSYAFDFRGPSMAIDTMCSSSLVAIHEGCRHLRCGECDVALVGGVNAYLHPSAFVNFSRIGMLSSDDKARVFGAGADGTVPGEGVGALLLKPLAKALEDRDLIHGVIRGSATNHGGRANGFTVPNPAAQRDLIRQALEQSGVDARTVSYVEAHGTGTALGDPIELRGLSEAFRKDTQDLAYCAIGSVKTNIGHLEAAAGIAGVTKVLLQMRHRRLVPSLHAGRSNPRVDFERLPFRVVQEAQPWEPRDGEGRAIPRIASVSSFGAGGSNAHVILEEYERRLDEESAPRRVRLPPHPFARETYRLRELESTAPPATVEPTPTPAADDAWRPWPFPEDVDWTQRVREHDGETITLLWACESERDTLVSLLRELEQAAGLEAGLSIENVDVRGDLTPLYEGNSGVFLFPLAGVSELGPRLARFLGEGRARCFCFSPSLAGPGEDHGEAGLRPSVVAESGRGWTFVSQSGGEAGAAGPLLLREWLAAQPSEDPHATVRHVHYLGAERWGRRWRTPPRTEQRPYRLEKRWKEKPLAAAGPGRFPGGVILLVNEESVDLARGLRDLLDADRVLLLGPQEVAAALDQGPESELKTLSLLVDLSDLYLAPCAEDTEHLSKIAFYQAVLRSFSPLRILYFTHGLQVFGAEPPSLAGAGFAGLVKMLSAEYRHVGALAIDLDRALATDPRALLEVVEREARAPLEESEVCYRGGRRFVPYLEASEIAGTAGRLRVDPEGVYVISGGTNGIGLEIGKLLVERGARKLVLMGITPLPPRDAWEQELAGGRLPADVSSKLAELAALARRIPHLEIYTGRLTELEELREFFAGVGRRLGWVKGVVHSAGVYPDLATPAFVHKSLESMQKVFEPKMRGLENLYQLFGAAELEFFVAFSSLTGLIPRYAKGISDYGMANAFVDFFMAHRFRQEGGRACRSITWVDWNQTGAAVRGSEAFVATLEQNLNSLGFLTFSNAVGRRFFEQSLDGEDRPWVLLSHLDHGVFSAAKDTMLFVRDGEPEAVVASPSPPARDAGQVTALVRRSLQEVLELKQVEDDRLFGDYGLDSIAAMLFSNRLERELGEQVPPGWLVDFPTVQALSGHLVEQYKHLGSKQETPAETLAETPVAGALEPIAIVGLAGMLPQSPSVRAFWEALDADRCLLEEIPKSRFDAEAGGIGTRWGGFVPDVRGFDPEFFGILPGVADRMDPRQRLLLMAVHHCLEDAGYAPASLEGSATGVFVAAENEEYRQLLLQAGVEPERSIEYGASMLANRISYFFDLRGPSETVSTMCSSAAVAVHRAVRALRAGEVSQAVVAAVNLILSPEPYRELEADGLLSPAKTVKSFGAEAGGHLRSEGVGSLLLKPLSRAQADGDAIYGLIRNTAVNYNGQSGVSMAAPNAEAHEAVILSCYRGLGLDVRDLGYVEAQGMGNVVADLVEWKAYNRALRQLAQEQGVTLDPGHCRVSSLKPMIGHMEPASALGAIFKILRSFETGVIHKVLDFTAPSPALETRGEPCRIAVATEPWPRQDRPRLAGLHSFGIGGNNAHILLEEFVPAPPGVEKPIPRRRLPPYPFQRRVCWFEAPLPAAVSGGVERRVRETLGPLYKVAPDALDLDRPFYASGFDSLLVLRVCATLRQSHGLPLTPAELFRATTPRELVAHLEAKLGAAGPAPKPALSAPALRPARENGAIAIIGLAGSYPHAPTLGDFWRNLVAGKDCIEPIPAERWSLEGFYEPDPVKAQQSGKSYGKWGGWLEDLYRFDPLVFNISPAEAESINPKDRQFLQCAWHVLEDAGYTPEGLADERVGVFVGVTRPGVDPYLHSFFTVANRVSYAFDFKGPSLPVDTACSSSLVAIHEACLHLRAGECSVALAGGVHALLHPSHLVVLSEKQFLSPRGKCRSFGADADGMVVGEGVGAVLLKPLADALRDGDPIHAVIRGSAVNHGGKGNGFTVPSPKAQEELIREALERGGVEARDVSYVEAHGTGTSLGDPIEILGLSNAFGRRGEGEPRCRIGSVKTNVGHLEAAAGIAGLTKVILQMRHRRWVPSLHAAAPSPEIDFAQTPFAVQQTLEPWEVRGTRIACLSSFGAGGSNAHLVVEEYGTEEVGETHCAEPQLIVLSAKTAERLAAVAKNLLRFLSPSTPLRDLAHTLQVGRIALEERLGIVVGSVEELREQLQGFLDGRPRPGLHRGNIHDAPDDGLDPEERARLFELWIAKGKYDRILESWVRGLRVDWSRLSASAGPAPRRIRLPLYPFGGEIFRAEPARGAAAEVLLYRRVWEPREVPESAGDSGPDRRVVISCGLPRLSETALELSGGTAAERYAGIVTELFERIRAELSSMPAGSTLFQVLIPAGEPAGWLRGVSGLLRSAHLENGRFWGQLVEVEPEETEERLLAKVLENQRAPQDAQVRYDHGRRRVTAWQEVAAGREPREVPWVDGGVYLITGGLGGLGIIFAREILRHAPGAALILVGRSPLDGERKRRLDALGAVRAEYRAVDLARGEEVRALIESVTRAYGKIDGILHAAGVHHDNFILRKTAAELRATLAPKVDGVEHLDLATRGLALDFFVVFSSVAGALGNAGQSDYASANGFLEPYAEQRRLAAGKTVCIHWPYWRDGGMELDADSLSALREKTGAEPLPAAAGIEAFYRALAAGETSVMVLHGEAARLRRWLMAEPTREPAARPVPGDGKALHESTVAQLKRLLAPIVKLPESEIRSRAPLETYGIDSVMVLRLNRDLEEVFGDRISKTVFYEHQHLEGVASHLVETCPEECAVWCGAGTGLGAPEPVPVRRTAPSSPHRAEEPIAIIGLAGRYPQAETLQELWENLATGKDCVSEIPRERWSLEGFFHADPEEAVIRGKSYSRWGSFLEGFAEFDPLFFNIAPREALTMDPQERLFLQSAWAVLEDAGYTRESLRELEDRNVGVFVGITKTGFDLHGPELWRRGEVAIHPHTSFGSVANRVSYHLDLRGPSLALDTLCSSSLAALHIACEHLRSGSCTMAIAGGVNLYLHPSSYVGLCSRQMLSVDGRCKSFGKGGNGFVPGEGMGTVLLKPLSRALADDDRIYAVIRATSMNHDGKTHGYTVPNPVAQAELIRAALDRAGIDARTISYVEAHGSGTELGDPIEVTGLTRAFRADTAATGFCALGSLKSNLGHLEAAAGIAGLTKVVLQMQHRQRVPSLHTAELNPHIPFASTPFVVQRKLEAWERPVVEPFGEVPLRAGISSFGAGGTNVHVVVEEAPEREERGEPAAAEAPYLIVLSARNPARLGDMVENLRRFAAAPFRLRDLAYTLQVGREAMEERLAFAVASRAELEEKLAALAEGRHAVDACLCERDRHRLLEPWLRGDRIDWGQLYAEPKPRRIGLPTYPFARDRYWLETAAGQDSRRFRTELSGELPWLADHVVCGRKMLPGVVYLEMARAAVCASVPGAERLRLEDVDWVSPLTLDDADRAEVEVRLFRDDPGPGRWRYTITDGETLHSQGFASVAPARVAGVVPVAAIRERLSGHRLAIERCYDAYERMGIAYGPAHRGLAEVYAGADEVLARLVLPPSVRGTQAAYVLHPSLMDGALQAAIGLTLDLPSQAPALPFALEALEIYAPCTAEMWCWLRRSNDLTGQRVSKLDLDLCDAEGRLCVELRGFSVRSLETRAPEGRLTRLGAVWDVLPAPLGEPPFAAPSARTLMIGGTEEQRAALRRVYPQARSLEVAAQSSVEEMAEQMRAAGLPDHLIWIAPEAEQRSGTLQVFRLVKALLRLGYADRQVDWTLITSRTHALSRDEAVDSTHAGVEGLVGSAAQEYPHWRLRLVDLPASAAHWPVRDLASLPAHPRGDAVVYREGEWFARSLVPLRDGGGGAPPYRKHGVYVVIGGAGGIGEVWSRHVIAGWQAKVFWLGRREQDETIRGKIERLAALGPAPEYLAVDATDRAALERAYEAIRRAHGPIHGVIHSAIVLRDQSLAAMDEASFLASFDAKMLVSLRLAQVFGRAPLDFVLFFSSMISFGKSPGQSNYAAGCTFMDAFAQQLAREWPAPGPRPLVKVMNWGYWGSVGIVKDVSYRERMIRAGVGSIEPEEAMAALDELLRGPLDQMGLVKTVGDEKRDDIASAEWLSTAASTAPSWLRSLPAVSAEQERRSEAIRAVLEREIAQLEPLLLRLLWAGIAPLGCLEELERFLAGRHGRWLGETLARLAAGGFLRDQTNGGSSYAVLQPPENLATLWTEWRQLRGRGPWEGHTPAQLELLEACLHALPSILRGEQEATDVLFPDSSLERVEGIYRGHPVADHLNDLVASTVVTSCERRLAAEPSTKIRILEVGAGTGGTTAELLRRLRPLAEHVEEYRFTDLSKAFLLHAERELAPAAPFLRTAIFDVERSPAEQGIALGHYDLVIAVNVLHATAQLRNALRNVKATLRRHGSIVLSEMCEHTLFAHLTFGLLDGWWLYEETALRLPGGPAVAPETWKNLLEQEGWGSVQFPGGSTRTLNQQIIVAESDGIVRQRASEASSPAAAPAPKTPVARNDAESLLEKSTEYIKGLVASALKMPPHQIDPAQPLEVYGLDSILVVHLTQTLRQCFRNIKSTLFFEVQTIDALVEHLLATQKEALARLVGGGAPASAEASAHAPRRAAEPAGNHRDVAVIGLSGRYPMARDLETFWRRLRAGESCISEIPAERWDWRKYFSENRGKPGSISTRWGGFLDEVDRFDPFFFQIPPSEAERVDPQERLFLEMAYQCIEDAGYTPETLGTPSVSGRKVGVFVGAMNSTYASQPSFSSIANRVSYFCNFQGPSLTVDTACSSSLTAIHLALESLYSGTSSCAIAGGVNLILHPRQLIRLSEIDMLSPSKECKAFGDRADGFVSGEGVGAVLLKPLDQALADGDAIYGVLKGSMVNAGGKTNGYTVPNPHAQYQLIADALKTAGVPSETVSYIEAHGTGTALGDPIEVSGLTRAFREAETMGLDSRPPCSLGSVKTNIGHTESAAGIAGVTKVLLQMQHGQLVPSLHSRQPNPEIDFGETPFRVQQELAPWERPRLSRGGRMEEYPRIAGVSSFGAGGANAHLVLEEYRTPAASQGAPPEGPFVFLLSAKDPERLSAYALEFRSFLRRRPADLDLGDLAYTLQVGRRAMEERLGLLVESFEELEEGLTAFLEGREPGSGGYRGSVRSSPRSGKTAPEDRYLRRIVDGWLEKKDHERLLTYWAQGFAVDWSRLYPPVQNGSPRPRRTRLPTYPFARERCWAPQWDDYQRDDYQRDHATGGNGAMAMEIEETASEGPLQVITNAMCGERQRAFLKTFVAELEQRTRKSKQAATLSRDSLSDQRMPIYFNQLLKAIQYPLTYASASGSRVEDLDGNTYVDISGDFGVNLFGHRPEFLSAALKRQIDRGLALSGRYAELGEAAELFCQLTGHERVCFCQSGTEAVMSALRVARAHTGRTKVVTFQGSYHGHFDGFLNVYLPGVLSAFTSETLTLDYGTDAALEAIEAHAAELAAVVVEPVQSRRPDLQPVAFLRALRELTTRHGILLIFDEMVTGFRIHVRGCQGYFGIEADLATYGKILGGGYTAGALAGRLDVMKWIDGGNWRFDDASKPKPITFLAGTHTQNPLKMAATLAVLREIEQRSSEIYPRLDAATRRLVDTLNAHARRHRLPLELVSFGSLFRFRFASEQLSLTEGLFLHLLNHHGVRYNLHGNCFLTTAHSDEDVEAIIAGVERSLVILRREGFFSRRPEAAPEIEQAPPARRQEAPPVPRQEAISLDALEQLIRADVHEALSRARQDVSRVDFG